MKTLAFNYCIDYWNNYGDGVFVIEPVKWIMSSGVNQCKGLYKKIILLTDDPEYEIHKLINIIEDDMDEGRQLIGRQCGTMAGVWKNGRYCYKYFNEKDFRRLQWFIDWLESKLNND